MRIVIIRQRGKEYARFKASPDKYPTLLSQQDKNTAAFIVAGLVNANSMEIGYYNIELHEPGYGQVDMEICIA